MAEQIIGEDQYKEAFARAQDRERALRYAHDIRKFEIDLYWRRATYFWTLIAAAFAGYFALSVATKPQPLLVLLISCIGLVLSLGWYLVNRGSKYWQENWERHVDALEDDFVGPLYKTTISHEKFPWLHVWSGYPYSVSRVNQLISLFITFVWAGLVASSFLPFWTEAAGPWVLLVTTVLFAGLLVFLGRSRTQGEAREVNFRKSRLG